MVGMEAGLVIFSVWKKDNKLKKKGKNQNFWNRGGKRFYNYGCQ
jgi:hypothetical protein